MFHRYLNQLTAMLGRGWHHLVVTVCQVHHLARGTVRMGARTDRADGFPSVIVFAMLFPFLIGITITILDTYSFSQSQGYMERFAGEAAKMVAIQGGTGTLHKRTSVEDWYERKDYAQETISLLDARNHGEASPAQARAIGRIKAAMATMTPVEKRIVHRFYANPVPAQILLTGVDCGPDYAELLQDRPFCRVEWQYYGYPASGLSLYNTNIKQLGTGVNTLVYGGDATVEHASDPKYRYVYADYETDSLTNSAEAVDRVHP